MLGDGTMLALTHQNLVQSQVVHLNSLDLTTGRLTLLGRTPDYLSSIAAFNCIGSVTPDQAIAPAAGGSLAAGVLISPAPVPGRTPPLHLGLLLSTTTGKGTGAIDYTVAANTGVGRSGSILAAGSTISVKQLSALNACPATLSPNQTVTGAAGTLNVIVTVASDCTWSATSSASWITIQSGGSGVGSGTLVLNIAANTGTPRNGDVSIAGQIFTVTQQSAVNVCPATFNPTALTFAPTAGSLDIGVSVASNCAWTATSALPWATITSGASGIGNGTVTVQAAANTGATGRSGSISISGQSYNVTQLSGINTCPATLTPGSQQTPAVGGNFQISVAVGSACTWDAVSTVPWITITSAGGAGSGNVTYTVASNAGYARSAVLKIAGQTFAVSEAGVLAGTLYAVNGGGGSTNSHLLILEPIYRQSCP